VPFLRTASGTRKKGYVGKKAHEIKSQSGRCRMQRRRTKTFALVERRSSL